MYRNLCPGVRRAIVTPVITPLQEIIKILESLRRSLPNPWNPLTVNLLSDLFQVVNLISDGLFASLSVKLDCTLITENGTF
jgi:hypothetical protein